MKHHEHLAILVRDGGETPEAIAAHLIRHGVIWPAAVSWTTLREALKVAALAGPDEQRRAEAFVEYLVAHTEVLLGHP